MATTPCGNKKGSVYQNGEAVSLCTRIKSWRRKEGERCEAMQIFCCNETKLRHSSIKGEKGSKTSQFRDPFKIPVV